MTSLCHTHVVLDGHVPNLFGYRRYTVARETIILKYLLPIAKLFALDWSDDAYDFNCRGGGGVSIQRRRLTSIGISIIKITISHDRLIIIAEIPIPGKTVFHLGTRPWSSIYLRFEHSCRWDSHILGNAWRNQNVTFTSFRRKIYFLITSCVSRDVDALLVTKDSLKYSIWSFLNILVVAVH